MSSILPKPLGDLWDAIPDTMAPGNPEGASRLRTQLQSLARYDMARISERQLEALRAIISDTAAPDRGRQLRVAVMHHHLRSPSLREELKPFSDMSNLEQVRAFLRGSDMGVVVHGHKHEHATYFDHIYVMTAKRPTHDGRFGSDFRLGTGEGGNAAPRPGRVAAHA
ncbi:hypothetical protein BSZ21_21050 [Bradyrhizobium canariense]|uniref:metallophosphoesterase family protein n=1 Tax=Bradyrhizobium canariense TaxID=255045 RepID=UPI000A1998CF|nr:metallophosphoesterase [Bradyrhizobium canariense]OSI65606.1 hypothetical protein BSZ21_21050 [Bradyrhizobium canariense]